MILMGPAMLLKAYNSRCIHSIHESSADPYVCRIVLMDNQKYLAKE